METNPDHELETNASKENIPDMAVSETSIPETNIPETPKTPETGDAIPKNAVLIIEGVKAYPLKESVINIGRKFENQIIIDDPRISRQHAQLRAIKGHFVLFDLHSTGGTFVNGQRTNQIVLYSGDVISLAGVTVTFTQDDPTPLADLVDTSPLDESKSGQRSTPTMEKSTIDERINRSKSEGRDTQARPRDG